MMNRREFGRSVAGLAVGTAAASVAAAVPGSRTLETKDVAAVVPFKISVMLWTVFRGQPFAQRLDKVA